jgi:hypothetical protein
MSNVPSGMRPISLVWSTIATESAICPCSASARHVTERTLDTASYHRLVSPLNASCRFEPGDELYFDSNIERQFRDSDCTPSVASCFTKYFEE